MKQKTNPVIVGGFVIGGILLGIVALLSFGGDRYFGEPVRFVVVLEDVSTSGLDPGSPVKLSGVRIGRVESVKARYQMETNKVSVRIVCDVDEHLATSIFPEEANLHDLILAGLQAKPKLTGITGLLYLELLINHQAKPTEVFYDEESGRAIVPAAPDTLAEFMDALTKISTGLAEIDYKGISDGLTTMLANANDQITKSDIAGTIQSFRSLAESLQTVVNDENIPGAIAALNSAAEDLDAVFEVLSGTTPEIAADLAAVIAEAAATMEDIQELAKAAESLISSQTGLPTEAAITLERLQRTAASIERLADYLQRNPSSVIRGRPSESN